MFETVHRIDRNILGFEVFQKRPSKQSAKPPFIGVAFTKEEIEKVERFHNDRIREKIRHYPIPLNRSGQSYGIITTQYVVGKGGLVR
jgi:hypothetical protein